MQLLLTASLHFQIYGILTLWRPG